MPDGLPGRPLGLTPELLKAISTYASIGAQQKDICVGLGIARRSWDRWRADGKHICADLDSGAKSPADLTAEQTVLAAFWLTLLQGRSKCVLNNLAIIQSAAKRDWKAAQYLVKVHAGDRYREGAQEVNVNLSGGVVLEGVEIEIEEAPEGGNGNGNGNGKDAPTEEQGGGPA